MSNEKIIRQIVKDKFNSQFPESYTFDEFAGGTLTTRPDLATFLPDSIIFTEIKSDKDSLVRLDSQIRNYKAHANHVYVILDQVHHKKWVQINKNMGYEAYCNTYFYKDGKFYYPSYDGSPIDREVKDFVYHHYRNTPISILEYLWKSELHNFFHFIKGRSKIIDETAVVKSIYIHNEIIDMCHEIIYDRVKTSAELGSDKILYSDCKQARFDVKHREHKQMLFNEIDNDKIVKQKIIKNKPAPQPLFIRKAREKAMKNKKVL